VDEGEAMSERQPLTARDLAVEFTELWPTLDHTQINTMLARNVSVELLEFFASYASEFAEETLADVPESEELERRLPNLLIIGYIIRILEERVE
jgi:hypothetical protein